MFKYARKFNRCIGDWDVGNVVYMQAMFKHAEDFNQDITRWDVSNVKYMDYMFYHADDFNQSIGAWGSKTSLVTDMQYMFYLATSFQQDIGSWNIGNVTTMKKMFYGVDLGRTNYESLLLGWDSCPTHQTGVLFHGGNSTFTHDSAADTARSDLIGTYSWSIDDENND
jgi:surface protein